VLGPELPAHAARPADDDGDLELPARRVVEHAGVVRDLVVGQQQEPHVHALDDDAQARHRRADADAHEAVLADRRVEQPQVPVLLVEVERDLVGAAVVAHVLAHQADGRVALHLLVDGLAQGLPHHPLVGVALGGGAGRDGGAGAGGDGGTGCSSFRRCFSWERGDREREREGGRGIE